MTWFKRRRTRRRAMGGATVGVVVATALVAQMSMVSNASWNDSEWVNAAPVGTVDCADPAGAFATRGEGRALSGSLLGINLDTLAEASGVMVSNDGTNAPANFTPSGALPAPADPGYADPLDVTALSAINVNLGQGLLQLPLDNSTGVLGQFGSASVDGVAQGAAGYITSSGGIATDTGSGYPDLASLDLKQLLAQVNNPVANTLGDVANLSLEVGALAGRAKLDGCAAQWDEIAPYVPADGGLSASGNLTREYLAAGTDLVVTSPAVGNLVQGVTTTVNGVQSAVNGLTINVLRPLLVNEITALLNGVLGGGLLGVSLANINITQADVSIDLSAVTSLLTGVIGDDGGLLTIDLASGQIRVNIAALLAETYPAQYSSGLNGLPPNTDLLADSNIATTLTAAITGALNDWLADVTDALNAAVGAIQVDIKAAIKLQIKLSVLLTVPLATINLSVSGGLDQLQVNAPITLEGGLLGLLGQLLLNNVLSLLDNLVSALVSGIGGRVQSIVQGTTGIVRALPETVNDLATPIVNLVSTVYTRLFLDGVVQILVNAQNDPFSGGTEPADWATTSDSGIPDGQYDVAALRIGVLGALSENDVRLYLGRGSVGPVCSQSEVAAGGCANY